MPEGTTTLAILDWQGVALVITSLGTLVASVGAVIVSIRNSTQIKSVQSTVAPVVAKVEEQTVNIQKIEKATNSMKDALVKATHDAAMLQGASDQRGKQALIDKGRAQGIAEQIASAPSSAVPSSAAPEGVPLATVTISPVKAPE